MLDVGDWVGGDQQVVSAVGKEERGGTSGEESAVLQVQLIGAKILLHLFITI